MSRLIILFYILKVVCAGGNSYVEDDLPISSTLSEISVIPEENVQEELFEYDEEDEIDPRNLDDDALTTSSPKPTLEGEELTESEQKPSSELKEDVEVSPSEPLESLSRKISRRLVKIKPGENE